MRHRIVGIRFSHERFENMSTLLSFEFKASEFGKVSNANLAEFASHFNVPESSVRSFRAIIRRNIDVMK